MSRGEQCLSFWVGLTHPSRIEIRQQCVSTGKTFRSREYINTQRAIFLPTPGRDNKNDSASLSSIDRNGSRVTEPKRLTMESSRLRIAFAFKVDKPPLAIVLAISSVVAFNNFSLVEKAFLIERKEFR